MKFRWTTWVGLREAQRELSMYRTTSIIVYMQCLLLTLTRAARHAYIIQIPYPGYPRPSYSVDSLLRASNNNKAMILGCDLWPYSNYASMWLRVSRIRGDCAAGTDLSSPIHLAILPIPFVGIIVLVVFQVAEGHVFLPP